MPRLLHSNLSSASNKMGKISGKHADALSKDDASRLGLDIYLQLCDHVSIPINIQNQCTYLGCVWDGESGCHDGCDPVSMESRCQRFSHDQEACEGKEGQDDWYPTALHQLS